MLEYLFYLVLGIVIYRYLIWYEALTVVPLKQCYIKYGMYLHPWVAILTWQRYTRPFVIP